MRERAAEARQAKLGAHSQAGFFPLGDALEVFIRREVAERFIEEVRGDDPEVGAKLSVEERELGNGRAELGEAAA